MRVKITPAQIDALEIAGALDADAWDPEHLRLLCAAIVGETIEATAEVAAALHEIANTADDFAQARRHDPEDAAYWRRDSRALTALACKVSKTVTQITERRA